MQATAERLITVDEFDEFLRQPENQGRAFELVTGEIIEKMPTDLHAGLAAIIAGLLIMYGWGRPTVRVRIEGHY